MDHSLVVRHWRIWLRHVAPRFFHAELTTPEGTGAQALAGLTANRQPAHSAQHPCLIAEPSPAPSSAQPLSRFHATREHSMVPATWVQSFPAFYYLTPKRTRNESHRWGASGGYSPAPRPNSPRKSERHFARLRSSMGGDKALENNG